MKSYSKSNNLKGYLKGLIFVNEIGKSIDMTCLFESANRLIAQVTIVPYL